MRELAHYYHTTQAALNALPPQAERHAIFLPDGSALAQIDWTHEPNEQAAWEKRADVASWGTLLDPGIPTTSLSILATLSSSDTCYTAVKKLIARFGGMRLKI